MDAFLGCTWPPSWASSLPGEDGAAFLPVAAQGCQWILALSSWTPFTQQILNVHLYIPRGPPSGSVERIHPPTQETRD